MLTWTASLPSRLSVRLVADEPGFGLGARADGVLVSAGFVVSR